MARAPRGSGPSLMRSAHGAAAECGALLVVEVPRLSEERPPDAARTEAGLAWRRTRGRPFERGNTAASNRGPSLTRITCDPDAPEEKRRQERRAQSLMHKRERELSTQYGGPVSSGVKVELRAWARATASADTLYREGKPLESAALDEKASGHQLKALAIVEREAASRPKQLVDVMASIRALARAPLPTPTPNKETE
jgi:hypothetical protein